jgi:uncharacterized cupredoxin-like copper-binding protein
MQALRMAGALAAAVAIGLTAGAARTQITLPGGPPVINVTMSEFKFAPAEIDLQSGQPYQLHIVNDGKRSHDLSAKAFFSSVQVSPDDKGAVKDGVVELTVGESADVAIIAGKPGTYEMHCDHPLHAMLGMKGTIVVR